MTLKQRVETTRVHFQNGDSDLAYSNLLDGVLESEDLSLFETIISNEMWKENHSKNEAQWIEKCLAILDRLEKVEVSEKSSNQYLLKCENLEKRYARGSFTLGPVSLEIRPGQLIGLVGENGNGKTTLLRILAKEIGHSGGELIYNNAADFNNNFDHRTKLTYIPQRTQSWYGKIRTNLKFCATHYGIAGKKNELLVELMLIRFGLYKFRELNWSELSSGYKMRFELARTFLRRPEILLLDEPLANLDVFAQQIVLNDLRSLAKSSFNPIGIILSSQQLFEVEKVADEVIFLKNGTPKLLDIENKKFQNQIVIELETSVNREEIALAVAKIPQMNIHFNGGSYILTGTNLNNANEILEALIQNQIAVQYFRDISNSSKRFFVD